MGRILAGLNRLQKQRWSYTDGISVISAGTGGVDSPGYPASMQIGDLMIGCAAYWNDTGGLRTFRTDGVNWDTAVHAAQVGGNSPNGVSGVICYKFVEADETSKTLSFNASTHCASRVFCVRGVIPEGNPVNTTNTFRTVSSGTTITGAEVTTTVDNCLIVTLGAVGDNVTWGAWTTASLAVQSPIQQYDYGNNTGYDNDQSVLFGIMQTAGSTGSPTMSNTVSESEIQANCTAAFIPSPYTFAEP